MRKTKLAIIGTAGIPAKNGGFETLAEQLVEHLGNELAISVYCPARQPYGRKQRQTHYQNARLVYLPLEAKGILRIAYDGLSILHALFYADVLLVLSVRSGFILPFVRFFTRKKIIVCVGSLEWKKTKRSRLASWYLWVAEWLAVRYSHADISDNESIQDYMAIRYQTLSHLIEYGADHAMTVRPTPQDQDRYPFLKNPYAFTVCRIEPDNNSHLVLDAFAQLPRHTIVMVGNWDDSDYGRALRRYYRYYPNLVLLDPIYYQRQLDLLRSNCLVYVHGHSTGGTNPSLVEAMYLGLPILAYDIIYNRTTTEGRALFFRTADELRQHIQGTSVGELKQRAAELKAIAHRRYTWAVVARKYTFLIRQVRQTSAKGHLVSKAGSQLPGDWLIQAELAHLQSPVYFYE